MKPVVLKLTFVFLVAIVFVVGKQAAAQQPTLQREDERDLTRVNGTSAELANRLRDIASPSFINSLLLIRAMKPKPEPQSQYMLWHEVVLSVSALDHAPTPAASPSSYHEQFGPVRTSRAFALVHLAMFEAANAYEISPAHQYKSYLNLKAPDFDKSQADLIRSAAIVEAAYGTLSWMYPGLVNVGLPAGQSPDSDTSCLASTSSPGPFGLRRFYACSIQQLMSVQGGGKSVAAGLTFGRTVVAEIIRQRRNDGSNEVEPSWGADFVPVNVPDASGNYPVQQWQKDPVSGLNIALGGRWAAVNPFALTSTSEFRLLDSNSAMTRYGLMEHDPKDWPSYKVVSEHGTDVRLNTPPGANMSSFPNLYYIAKFWAYDATAGLCAPVRLYNQIADSVLAKINLTNVADIARYYALINLAMADAGIAAWDSKYYFQFARPVTAIRAQQRREHPDSRELWFPLGAQNTNSSQTYNITPPFPAYPSGHAVFGGALFGILRQYLASNGSFDFRSDEFNGTNKDVYNFLRCVDGDTSQIFCSKSGRSFTIDCAERENADSRIWMGVHWMFDADDGIYLGNQVAYAAFNRILEPISKHTTAPLDAFEEHSSGRTADDAAALKVFTVDQRKKLACADVRAPDSIFKELYDSYPPTSSGK